jgi:hypothetical protein
MMMMMIIVSLSFQNAEDQDTQINNVTYFVRGFKNNLLWDFQVLTATSTKFVESSGT